MDRFDKYGVLALLLCVVVALVGPMIILPFVLFDTIYKGLGLAVFMGLGFLCLGLHYLLRVPWEKMGGVVFRVLLYPLLVGALILAAMSFFEK